MLARAPVDGAPDLELPAPDVLGRPDLAAALPSPGPDRHRPAGRLGSALKKAGAWLGIGGKSKPGAAPEASAAGAASTAEADRKQMEAMIAKLDTMIQEQTAELGERLASINDAVEIIADVIDPAERQEIVRQQPA
jgi:hypothetical protein